MSAIVFEHVTMEYVSDQPVLSDVSTSFDQGTITFITGRSGAGKTTMLRLLLGLIKPTRGAITVNDVDISSFNRRRAALYRSRIGTVFQSHSLINGQSVFDNVAMPLLIEGFSSVTIRARVSASLQAVDLLEQADLKPEWLSEGQKQRIAIARAVVNQPHLLIADEPTGNLDPALAVEIMDLFRKFHEAGTTVLVATHDMSLPNTGDRAIIVEDGDVIEGVVSDQ